MTATAMPAHDAAARADVSSDERLEIGRLPEIAA
jgi:hypothetical protein